MSKLKAPVGSTILSDAGPLTADERKQRADDLAKWNLDALLAFADYNPSFAEHLCKKVAVKYGKDDHLSALLSKWLRIERMGKPIVRRRTWTYPRYYVLLVHYAQLLKFMERQDALLKLADMEKFNGDNRAKKIEAKITEARNKVRIDDLPVYCRPPLLCNTGG